jgi:putative oxidoreductase
LNIGQLALRGVVGPLFVGHGTQKLFGWFGGHGLEATGNFFESMGMRPGRQQASAAAAAETGGGVLLIAGLGTPLAASTLISVMLTAINRIHFKNGLWSTDGGYEYNLVLIGALLALAEEGPGSLALGGDEPHGPGRAAAALAGGVIGALGAHAYAAAQPAPQRAAPSEPPVAESRVTEVVEPLPVS